VVMLRCVSWFKVAAFIAAIPGSSAAVYAVVAPRSAHLPKNRRALRKSDVKSNTHVPNSPEHLPRLQPKSHPAWFLLVPLCQKLVSLFAPGFGVPKLYSIKCADENDFFAQPCSLAKRRRDSSAPYIVQSA